MGAEAVVADVEVVVGAAVEWEEVGLEAVECVWEGADLGAVGMAEAVVAGGVAVEVTADAVGEDTAVGEVAAGAVAAGGLITGAAPAGDGTQAGGRPTTIRKS